MKPKISEHETQSAILDWLDRMGIFNYRQNTGGAKLNGFYVRFGKKGAPDIVAVKCGRYIGIEVKKAGEEQSIEQKQYQERLERAGAQYILAYRLEDVTCALGKAGIDQ